MRVVPVIVAAGCVSTVLSHGAVVSFAESDYTVRAGESVSLGVTIAFEDADPARDLFSFGVRLLPELGTPLMIEQIAVAPELAFFGAGGANALIDPAPGVLGAKGNIVDFRLPYTGPHLVTYQVQFTQIGDYELDLDFFNTLGPTEQIFIGGDGSVLDGDLRFERASVRVIPEPDGIALVTLAALVLLCRRVRRSPV